MRDRADHEFLTILHRLQPATVQALCAATGVTATAVRQRLARLHAEGYLDREELPRDELAQSRRGRPSHQYSVTSQGLKTLGDNHGEMAVILWREIMRIEPSGIREQVLQGVKSALVERLEKAASLSAAGNPSGLADRVQQICSSLSQHGFDLEYAETGPAAPLPILKEHNCPYHELAEEDPKFCEFEKEVFSELIGSPVELSLCRRHGDRHCEFQVRPQSLLDRQETTRESPESLTESVAVRS
jgi:predicted ArsR family transcriptional regulator